VYREILDVYSGTSEAICDAFGVDRDTRLWGRHYLFWHQGKPMTMIYEVFNPRLAEWLGPCETASAAAGSAEATLVSESEAAAGSG
jgi:chorismate lyase